MKAVSFVPKQSHPQPRFRSKARSLGKTIMQDNNERIVYALNRLETTTQSLSLKDMLRILQYPWSASSSQGCLQIQFVTLHEANNKEILIINCTE